MNDIVKYLSMISFNNKKKRSTTSINTSGCDKNRVKRKYDIISSESGYLDKYILPINPIKVSTQRTITGLRTSDQSLLLYSANRSVFDEDRAFEEKHGILLYKDFLFSKFFDYKTGGKLSMNLEHTVSGHTDFYFLSCVSRLYPMSLTQNELINFPLDITDDTIKEINRVLKKYKDVSTLTKVDMIDHTIYHNELVCIIINKTFGLDKRRVGLRDEECLSTIVTGFCTLDAFYTRSEIVSKVCNIIESKIKEYNLNSNNAFKFPEDISLSDDIINYIRQDGDRCSIDTFTIKSQEFDRLKTDYYPYLDVDLLIKEFHESDDKLLILHGEAGVGKSKLSSIIAHRLSKNYNTNVVMFPGKLANSESAWTRLTDEVDDNTKDNLSTICIIDDVEPVYMNRTEVGSEGVVNNFFNNLLTMLDGVITTGAKFIITTNYVIKKELDAPLYRPGRLFDSLLIRPLTKQEAIDIVSKDRRVTKSKLEEFKAMDKKEYSQAFVSQFISESSKKIKRSYYKEKNKLTTSRKTKIGFTS